MKKETIVKGIFVSVLVSIGLYSTLDTGYAQKKPRTEGPADQGKQVIAKLGNAEAGKAVFREETFGNEGFWTDAARVPEGIVKSKLTPLKALKVGLSVDVDALDGATKAAVAAELKKDPSGASSKLFNDPATTVKLLNANSVIGLVVKDTNGDSKLDVASGDKVGVSCALCHTITDGSVLSVPGGGTIGSRRDGLTNHNLNVGAIMATAANSRAFYPVLQLKLKANKDATIGRSEKGLTEKSKEKDVDKYLTTASAYPVGMFDDTPDGNGNPMHITPFFRQDLAAPFGSGGEIARLDNFNNLVYTALLDPTNLTTTGGRAFLHKLGGAAGDEIVEDYVKILDDTKVTGYPYVKAPTSAMAGSEEAPIGLRVNEFKLQDLNAYLTSLQAPAGEKNDMAAINKGRDHFKTAGCAVCHNVDQSIPVPANIIPMKTIFPGDNPMTLAQRMSPLNPVLDTGGNTFDDKMIIVNASMRGEVRGSAMPLLLDLARKPVFLHDNSVSTLEMLFDPMRGSSAPHPFFILDTGERSHLIAFLRSLDTN